MCAVLIENIREQTQKTITELMECGDNKDKCFSLSFDKQPGSSLRKREEKKDAASEETRSKFFQKKTIVIWSIYGQFSHQTKGLIISKLYCFNESLCLHLILQD